MSSNNISPLIFDDQIVEYDSDESSIAKKFDCRDSQIDEISIKLEQIDLDINKESNEIKGYKNYHIGYKSALHYVLLRPFESGFPFRAVFPHTTDCFLLFLTNKELGLLDIALSERAVRKAFHDQLGYYYFYDNITCEGELSMLAKRHIEITRFVLDFTITSGQSE